jgi:Predicted carbamoyl transferase, NodU family
VKYILGISALYHDSAASLIRDGKILSAVQEERFTRIKHDSSFPTNSIKYILSSNQLTLNQIDKVVFYDKPFLKFERLLETYLSIVPSGFSSFRIAMPVWLREKLFLKNLIIRELKNIEKKFDKNKLLFSEHHFSHAASAFYPSPFERACILTLDGVGEWATTTIAIGNKITSKLLRKFIFPFHRTTLFSIYILLRI